MKKILFFTLVFSQVTFASDFSKEAPLVADSLKKNLMGNLQKELQKNGAVKAVDFCHLNVKPLGAQIGKQFDQKYEFGRTSHKIRNSSNQPQPWMEKYLTAFKSKKQSDLDARPFFHNLENGKQVYLDPLWVVPMCLQCHGENIPSSVEKEIQKRYSNDKARGFKVGDFRGFVWIKEK